MYIFIYIRCMQCKYFFSINFLGFCVHRFSICCLVLEFSKCYVQNEKTEEIVVRESACRKRIIIITLEVSAANKGRSMVNYHQFLAFDHPYFSCNDHHDGWVFQEVFIMISWKFFWTILKLLSRNLNALKHKFVFFLSVHFLLVVL